MKDKRFEVLEANTVPNEGTMMVHPQDTPFAHRAVMAPGRFYTLANRAKFEQTGSYDI